MTGVYSVNEIRAAERAVMDAGVSEDELIGRAAGKLFDVARAAASRGGQGNRRRYMLGKAQCLRLLQAGSACGRGRAGLCGNARA